MKPVVSEHLLSGLVAAGLAVAIAGAGLPAHLQHSRVGEREKRALLTVTRALGGVKLVPKTAEARTIGYADTNEGCAAMASVDVRTALSPGAVLSLYSGKGLLHLSADLVAHRRVRVETLRTFGLNPLDWSCWS